jgi:DNA-binding PadR family transcriptional regulator
MYARFHCYFGSRHGRNLGRFGKGFTDNDNLGGRPFGMGRKLASGDLQLLILALLAEKPRHGYEIIKALGERSQGFYVPSPGMVYPALTYLEEIGYATIEADGARKLYHITDAGRAHLEENRAAADALFSQFERVGQRMERVRSALRAGARDDESVRMSGSKELLRAHRDLKSALAAKGEASLEEQQRIAAILQRAATEIGSG